MVLVSLVQLCPCPEATSTPCMGCNCGTYLPAPLLPLPPAAAQGGGSHSQPLGGLGHCTAPLPPDL